MIRIETHIKYYILWAMFVLLAIVCYIVAIRPTIEQKHINTQLEERLELLQQAPQQIPILMKRIEDFDNVYFQKDISLNGNTELLVEEIGVLANRKHAVLSSYPGIHVYQSNKLTILTHRFVLTGSFHNLLKMLNALETTQKRGFVSAVKFHSEIDRRSKKRVLYMEVFIQIVQNQKDVT